MRRAFQLHSQQQAIQYNDTRWLVPIQFSSSSSIIPKKKKKNNKEKDSSGADDYGGYGDKRSPVN